MSQPFFAELFQIILLTLGLVTKRQLTGHVTKVLHHKEWLRHLFTTIAALHGRGEQFTLCHSSLLSELFEHVLMVSHFVPQFVSKAKLTVAWVPPREAEVHNLDERTPVALVGRSTEHYHLASYSAINRP